MNRLSGYFCCKSTTETKLLKHNFLIPVSKTREDLLSSLDFYEHDVFERAKVIRIDTALTEKLTSLYCLELASQSLSDTGLLLKESYKMLPIEACDFELFTRSQKISAKTNYYLGKIGFTLVTLAASISALGALTYINRSLSYETTTAVPVIASLIGGLTSNYMGMIFTGTNPNLASELQNQEQNRLEALEKRYQMLAKKLLQMGSPLNPTNEILARRFSETIKPLRIQKYLESITTQKDRVEIIVRPILNAINCVKNHYENKPFFVIEDDEMLDYAFELGYRKSEIQRGASITIVIT